MENFNVVLMSTFHFHINSPIWYKETLFMIGITNEFFQMVCVRGFEGNKMSPNPLRCTT